GDDIVDAGDGDDKIVGGHGEGNDIYEGGEGIDTIFYSSSTLGIVVNLSAAQNQAFGSEIGTDQIAKVENVIGGSGKDVITGNTANNLIDGGNRRRHHGCWPRQRHLRGRQCRRCGD